MADNTLPTGHNPKHTIGYHLCLLTKREKEVYDYLLTDLSQRQIAQKLYIEVKSLKFHLTNIYRKLEVNSRRDLIGKLLINEKHK